MNPKEFYDAFSREYRARNGISRDYTNRIDGAVLNLLQNDKSWLDVGTGDGARAGNILGSSGESERIFSACDTSPMMLELARTELGQERVLSWDPSTEDSPFGSTRFQVITLLSNVLGHVVDQDQRVNLLKRLSKVLTEDGVLALDFNNRSNLRQYGAKNVLRAAAGKALGTTQGVFVTHKQLETQSISTHVYLGTAAEYRRSFAASGLRIKNLVFHDYSTGRRRTRFGGQGWVELIRQNKER